MDSGLENAQRVAEVPLTEIGAAAFRSHVAISGSGRYLFPSEENPDGDQKTLKPFGMRRFAGRRFDTFASTISDPHTRLGSAPVA